MTNNPYLKVRQNSVTFSSELKRLIGSPLRALLTLIFVLVPLLLAIAGGVDWFSKFAYELKGTKDTRQVVWGGDCLLGKTATVKICRDKSPKIKVVYWPPFLPSSPDWFYALPLGIACFGFVSIGNPRTKNAGRTLLAAFGLKSAVSQETGPTRLARNPKAWLIGGTCPRLWQSDPGYFYYNKAKLVAYALNTDMLRTNLLIVAPPGSGKTASVFRPFISYARKVRAAAFFFDAKGADFDPTLFDLNFDLTDPAHSIKINLFAGDTPAQAGERLGEALIVNLSDDKQYYVDVAKDAMAALVSAHHAVFGCFPELTDLLLYLSEGDMIDKLEARLATAPNLARTEMQRLSAGLKRITSLLTNTKKDTLGSISTALTPLTTGAVADLLVANPSHGIYTIEELLKRPRLVRFSLPVAEYPRIAPIIGRIIFTQFNFAVLAPDCNKDIFKVACVDEAHNFITGSIGKGMAQARSNNAGYMLALQTLSQIPDNSLLDTIFAASGNKLVMAGVSDHDAERFSRTFGELELPYVSHGSSRGRNTSTTINTTSGSQHGGTGGTNVGTNYGVSSGSTSGSGTSTSQNRTTTTQLRTRRLFLPAEIRQLPQYHALIESSDASGQRWFVQLLDMSYPTVKKLAGEVKPGKTERAAGVKPAHIYIKLNKAQPVSPVTEGVANSAALTGTSSQTPLQPLTTSSESKSDDETTAETATSVEPAETATATVAKTEAQTVELTAVPTASKAADQSPQALWGDTVPPFE